MSDYTISIQDVYMENSGNEVFLIKEDGTTKKISRKAPTRHTFKTPKEKIKVKACDSLGNNVQYWIHFTKKQMKIDHQPNQDLKNINTIGPFEGEVPVKITRIDKKNIFIRILLFILWRVKGPDDNVSVGPDVP